MERRKRRPGHYYSVYVALYADEATKLKVERNEEDFKETGRILAQVFYSGILLCSLNPVIQDTAIMPMILGRTSPDPGCGSLVELVRRDTRSLLDLIGVGKTLSCERIAPEEPPPAFLQIQPCLAPVGG